MPTPDPPRSAVSVSDMARMVGLSRSRFHQLIQEGIFPAPETDKETGRPFYSSESQGICLEVRRCNRGINGKTIMFYARRLPSLEQIAKGPRSRTLGVQTFVSARKQKASPAPKSASASSTPKRCPLIDGLKQLGVSDVDEQAVSRAVAICFPQGVGSEPHEAVLLAVFRHLVRQN